MKLAIFDMDGTLFNTNDANYYSYKEALKQHNIEFNYDYFCNHCNGKKYNDFLAPFVNGDKKVLEDIHNFKKQIYGQYLDKIKINERIFDIMKNIKNEYKIALVTTASKKNTIDILTYTDKKKWFDFILTGDDIKNSKPDPEGFLKAINHFNVKPENCIIFEDSNIGIEAAKQTRATVVKVETF